MAVLLTGSGGLFTRLGKMGHLINVISTFFADGSAGNFPAELNDVFEQVDTASNEIRESFSALHDASSDFINAPEAMLSEIQIAAQQLLIQMVDDDDPLTEKAVEAALVRLIEQMSGSSTVDGNEPTIATVAGSGNTGSATVVTSLLNGAGSTMENVFAEDIELRVTANTTERNETITVKGEEGNAESALSVYWPSGSTSSGSNTVIDPSTDGSVTNGNFESFTSNDPDSWTIETGVAGNDIKEDTATVYIGSKCLEFDGDGSTQSEITQTITSLKPETPYVAHLATRIDVTPAAGVLKMALWDGSAIIADSNGVDNVISIDLTAASTSAWAKNAAVWRLPDPVPATVELRIWLDTALSTGSSAFVDAVCFGVEASQLYDSGPYIDVIGHDSAARLAIDDVWTVTVTNDYRGEFQQLFHRLFGFPNLQLPSNTAGAETIADTLIG